MPHLHGSVICHAASMHCVVFGETERSFLQLPSRETERKLGLLSHLSTGDEAFGFACPFTCRFQHFTCVHCTVICMQLRLLIDGSDYRTMYHYTLHARAECRSCTPIINSTRASIHISTNIPLGQCHAPRSFDSARRTLRPLGKGALLDRLLPEPAAEHTVGINRQRKMGRRVR